MRLVRIHRNWSERCELSQVRMKITTNNDRDPAPATWTLPMSQLYKAYVIFKKDEARSDITWLQLPKLCIGEKLLRNCLESERVAYLRPVYRNRNSEYWHRKFDFTIKSWNKKDNMGIGTGIARSRTKINTCFNSSILSRSVPIFRWEKQINS